MEKRVFEVALAGLMHDFGKIDRVEEHSKNSANSLTHIKAAITGSMGDDYENSVSTAIALVESHHEQVPLKGVPSDLFYALKFADWLASNYRESDEIAADESVRKRYSRIVSPFKSCSSGEEYVLANMSADRENNILSQMLKHVGLSSTSNGVLLSILLDQYFGAFAIPDAVKDGKIPLPVHNHLVSAIASSLVASNAFVSAVRDLGPNIRAKDVAKILAQKTSPMISLIGIDIHSIQDYIYTFETERGAMRTVAGRSMIVNVLSHVLPAIVADVFGVPVTNTIVHSGGKAILIVPYVESIDVRDLAEKISRDLWSVGIRVLVTIEKVDIRMNALFGALSGDLERPPSEVLQDALEELLSRLRDDTQYLWMRAKLLTDESAAPTGADARCSRCGAPLRAYDAILLDFVHSDLDSGNICEACLSAEAVKRALLDGWDDVCVEYHFHSIGYSIGIQGRRITLAKDGEVIAEFSVGEDGYIPIPAYYMRGDTNGILPLDQITRAIGVAKGDGDAMGKIFRDVLSESLLRYVALSFAISYFFERVVPRLFRKMQYNAHLVYAGGDDFLIVGCPHDVLRATADLVELFEKFKTTGSENITPSSSNRVQQSKLLPSVSVGFAVFPQKYKLLWAVEKVESLLRHAKDTGVNCGIACDGLKAGITYQLKQYVGCVYDLPSVLNTSENIIREIGAEVSAQRFYKVLQYSSELIAEYRRAGGVNIDVVRRYSYLRHYLNLFKREGKASEVYRIGRVVLESVLPFGGKRCEFSLIIPFVVAYLVSKGDYS